MHALKYTNIYMCMLLLSFNRNVFYFLYFSFLLLLVATKRRADTWRLFKDIFHYFDVDIFFINSRLVVELPRQCFVFSFIFFFFFQRNGKETRLNVIILLTQFYRVNKSLLIKTERQKSKFCIFFRDISWFYHFKICFCKVFSRLL